MKPIEDVIKDIRRAAAEQDAVDAPQRTDPESWEETDFWGEPMGRPEAPAAEPRPGGTHEPPAPPAPRRHRRRRWRRVGRTVLGLLLVAGLAAGGSLLILRDDGGSGGEPSAGSALLGQQVVSWAIWDPLSGDRAFAAVVAAGGGMKPLVMAVPGHMYVTVPGYGDALVGDVVALRNPERVGAAVENVLGVRVGASAGTSLRELGEVVDALGGIEAESRRMNGAAVLRYLRRDVTDEEAAGEIRLVRWQEVLSGLLDAARSRPDALEGLPIEVAGVLARGALDGADLVSMPVEGIGSGLVRPRVDALKRLVAERFGASGQDGSEVRLVVLNGNGTPGIGERVWKLLGPGGFRLVSSLNAPTFDEPETSIVASSEEFLDEARRARDLLGVGRVVMGDQPTGVADVTVVVGLDFGGS